MTSSRSGQRLLAPGYAKILRAVVDTPGHAYDIAERAGFNASRTRLILNGMRRGGILHISEWRRVKRGRNCALKAIYSFGPGQDAPCPLKIHRRTAPCPSELLSFCTMVKALEEGCWHGKSLAEHIGIDPRAARAALKVLHKLRLVHIDDYSKLCNGAPCYPMFTWGPDQRDLKKVTKGTKAESERQLRRERAAIKRSAEVLHAMVNGMSLDGRKSRSYNRLSGKPSQPPCLAAT